MDQSAKETSVGRLRIDPIDGICEGAELKERSGGRKR